MVMDRQQHFFSGQKHPSDLSRLARVGLRRVIFKNVLPNKKSNNNRWPLAKYNDCKYRRVTGVINAPRIYCGGDPTIIMRSAALQTDC